MNAISRVIIPRPILSRQGLDYFLRSDTEAEPQTNRGEVQTRRCFAAQLATRKNGPLTKKVLD